MLSQAYRDIYADSYTDDVGQMQLLTSPINSTEEVLQLYTGGLVAAEIAVPSVLNAIGASKDEIDAALERVLAERQKRERSDEGEDKSRARSDEDDEMLVKELDPSIASAAGDGGAKAPPRKTAVSGGSGD